MISAMRAGRLVTILRALQTHGRMTASELAATLEVSERTIYRDIEALSGAGVPVYAVRGARGGFELLRRAGVEHAPIDPWPSPLAPGRGTRAMVRLSPQGRRLAAVLGSPAGLRTRRAAAAPSGWVEATFRIESHESALHDLLALGADVEVLRPAALRALMADIAGRIAALHAEPATPSVVAQPRAVVEEPPTR